MKHNFNPYLLTILLAVLQVISLQAFSQQFEWGRSFTAGNQQYATATGRSVAVGKNDDVYVSGYFYGDLNVGGKILQKAGAEEPVSQGFLTRMNTAGTVLWARQLMAERGANYSALLTDREGEVYACGSYYGNLFLENSILEGNAIGNGVLVKYSKEGKLEWNKIFLLRPLKDIVVDYQDNIYAIGYEYNSNAEGVLEGLDTWLMKYDRAGNQLLNRLISRQTSSTSFISVRLAVDPEGNVFISGLAGGNALIGDIPYSGISRGSFVLIKCNAAGVPQWVKHVEDVPEGGISYSGDIICDGLGNIYYTTNAYTLSLSKLDPKGDVLWARRRPDIRLGIDKFTLDACGNLLVTGQYYGSFSLDKVQFPAYGQTIFVAQFNSEGEVQWKLDAPDAEGDYLTAIDWNPLTGDLYVTGIIQGKSPNLGNIKLPDRPGMGQALVLKISNNNYKPLVLDLGKNTGLCPGQSLELQVEGFVRQQWQDGSGAAVFRVQQPGKYYVTATDYTGRQHSDTLQVAICFEASIPNIITPNGDNYNDYFVINQLNLQLNNTLKIYNRWGKIVYSSVAYKNDWNAGGLSAGVYYYELHHAADARTYRGWVEVVR